MILAATVALLLTGPADDLTTTKIDALTLKVPAIWKHQKEGDTHRYTSPSDDGNFSVDVYAVSPPRDAKVCLEQLVDALGKTGWERVSLGAAPAARKVDVDSSEAEKDAFETTTYVGCNGRTKWALTFAYKARKKERYESLLKRISESIAYAGAK